MLDPWKDLYLLLRQKVTALEIPSQQSESVAGTGAQAVDFSDQPEH